MAKPAKHPSKTRQRRDLTTEKIVAATLEVLKSGDPSALTMRRVAEKCGVSAMAIYHHVNDKEELANLAVDSLFLKASTAPRLGANWREQVVNLWCGNRRDLLETPGAGMIFVRRAVIGPGTATFTEAMFALLQEGGLSGRAIVEAADAMTMLSIGSLANELTRPPQIRERLGAQLPPQEMPVMSAHLAEYANRDGAERYRLGLFWILDGIEQQERKGVDR